MKAATAVTNASKIESLRQELVDNKKCFDCHEKVFNINK